MHLRISAPTPWLRALLRIRSYWTRTGQRIRLTEALRPIIGELTGLVLDVGGGRHAPHDDAWPASTTRIRLDLSPVHDPDVIADARTLPIEDGVLDGAVMIELLEHVPDPARVVEEVHRVLRPGGTLVGSVPFAAPVHGDPHDYYRYSEQGLLHLLAGFATVEIRPLGNHYSAAWALIAARSRVLRILNPVMRKLGTRADPGCPQGYLFIARR